MTYSERRNTQKNTAYAVTPNTHGVTTAYAKNLTKPIQTLNNNLGVTNGVQTHLSNTPLTAMYNMA